ncbi:MAG: DUF6512 family protein [Bacilli bacterium]|nr:DUF6512 family protein [Bacilli bacterium]
MNLKKMIYINTIGTFLLCFLTHFLYTWFPNPVFAIFFPVNESIWEHMKMIYSSVLLFGIIEFIIIQKKKITSNNFLISLFLKAFISIPLFLLIYLPIYYKFGEHLLVTLVLLFFVLLAISFLGYKVQNIGEIKKQNGIAFCLIILAYIAFGYLTYRPLHHSMFFDTMEEKYGIHEYVFE